MLGSRAVGVVTLKAGHVQPVWAGHPWVFAQAIERVEGAVEPGDEVEVRDARGNALGRGLYSPTSAIPVRLYTRDREQPLDRELIGRRITAAVERRGSLGLLSAHTNAVRLVHGEGDELPGLIVDQLGPVLSLQVGTIGMQRRLDLVLDALQALEPEAIVDRSSERTARLEGFLPPRAGASRDVLRGRADLSAFEFRELGIEYRIPFALGQKTGYYLDQRPLRARIEQLARGRSVLDTYCYVGSCALAAARGGAAAVRAVDTSKLAIEVAAECAARNGLTGKIEYLCGDARRTLADAASNGGYDLVICDPPKLAPTRAARRRAGDAMRKLAAQGTMATARGGLLVLSSCSAAIGLAELGRSLALGARDAGAQATVLERVFQGADHPVPAAFPEGLYLTTLIAQIERC